MRSWDDLQRCLDEHPQPPLQPPLQRVPIVPPRLELSWKENLARLWREPALAMPAAERGWESLVEHRRRVALALTLVTTAALVVLSAKLLVAQQMPAAALRSYLVIYTVMTWFLAANAYKLLLGLWHTRSVAATRWHPSRHARDPAPEARVAIVYPVLHEDVPRVAAGMAATWNSIARGYPQFADRFDLFLLSDSSRLDSCLAEEAAVHELRAAFPRGRFFYRRRTVPANAKLGNITDFCRRWGRSYRYLLLMDADSVMDGEACVALLRMMEGNPQIGILQTNARPVLRQSLFGRMEQFAARLYGSVFSYSLQAMHMGHACYLGHNAMLRLEPLIAHCILPRLPGEAPWGGKPLSHDIVESALMARAGYEVWFLPDIEGTYEEVPANILGFLVRERRWMQGNLQHLRFLFLNGLRSIHRETFFTGSMGYVSAPLWAAFLAISAYGAINFLQTGAFLPGSFAAIGLPLMMLAISALVFLFLPRFLAFFINIRSDRARGFGGKDKLAWSMAIETVFSFFFSPIVMITITQFIWLWLKRRSISWTHAQRGDDAVPWPVCFRHFGWISVVGLLSLALLVVELQEVSTPRSVVIETFSGGWFKPGTMLVWFFPIVGGLAGSMLIVRFTSRSFEALRRARLFCIPEEIDVPPVLRDLLRWQRRFRQTVLPRAISDPGFYVRQRAQARLRPRVARALLPKINGGATLSDAELLLAVGERRCLDALHRAALEPRRASPI